MVQVGSAAANKSSINAYMRERRSFPISFTTGRCAEDIIDGRVEASIIRYRRCLGLFVRRGGTGVDESVAGPEEGVCCRDFGGVFVA